MSEGLPNPSPIPSPPLHPCSEPWGRRRSLAGGSTIDRARRERIRPVDVNDHGYRIRVVVEAPLQARRRDPRRKQMLVEERGWNGLWIVHILGATPRLRASRNACGCDLLRLTPPVGNLTEVPFNSWVCVAQ